MKFNIKDKRILIPIICLLLCAVIIAVAFAHCSGTKDKPVDTDVTSSQTDITDDEDFDDEDFDDEDFDDEDFDDEDFDDEDFDDEDFDDEDSDDEDFDDEDFDDEDSDDEDFDDEDFEDEDFDTVYSTVSLDLSEPVSDDYINSGLYLGWGYFPDAADRTYTKKEITAELDRLEKMGYTHVRTSLTTSWVSKGYDASIKDWKWDGEEFTRFVWICKELDKRGITLTMTINWDMVTDLSSSGILDKESYENTCENYANYAYKLLTTLKAKGVNNIVNILPFVEPFPSKVIDEVFGKHSNVIFHDTVKALDSKLKKEGIRKDYKIMCTATSTMHIDPSNKNLDRLNDLQFTKVSWAEWIVENCDSFVDIYAFHDYSSYSNNVYDDTYQYFYDDIIDVANVFKKTGKPVYFDEFGYQYNDILDTVESTYTRYLHRNVPFYATQRAAAQIAIMNAGVNCSMIWSIFDTQFPDSTVTNTAFDKGVQITGVAPIMSESSIPYAEYYSQSLISKYMAGAEGTVVYSGMDDYSGVYLTATKQKDGTFSILVANVNITDAEVTFELSESLNKAKLYRHLFDPNDYEATTAAHIIGVDKVFKNVNKTFTDTIPGGAVVVYTTNPD